MNIESEIYKKSTINIEELLNYGFIKEKNKYIYTKNILENNFKVIIEYDNKSIKGRIIDNQTELEYTNYRLESNTGTFSNKIKSEYVKILNDIKNKCTQNKDFIYPQTNRISKFIYEKYNVSPEFLWDDLPNCGVFRNKTSNKWFGIIMNINESKLKLKTNKEIEIINIKSDELTNKLIDNKSIFEAYHMNKKKWVSIKLDDTLNDNKIKELIEISYKSVNK